MNDKTSLLDHFRKGDTQEDVVACIYCGCPVVYETDKLLVHLADCDGFKRVCDSVEDVP